MLYFLQLKRTLATTTISGVEQTLNLAQSMLDQTEQARVQANVAFNQALTLLIGPSDLLPPQADSLNGKLKLMYVDGNAFEWTRVDIPANCRLLHHISLKLQH